MSFQTLTVAARQHFPDLQIKYKDSSPLMKFMSWLLFFNSGFMTQYTTTIGSSIYFPSEKFVTLHPVSSSVVLMHELVHLYDQKRVSKLGFIISYLFPQILAPLCLLLCLLISWKIMLPLTLLCLAPTPAFFRTYWEKRAYLSSFYVIQLLSNKMKFDPHLQVQENFFLQYLYNGDYYMFPIHSLRKSFDDAIKRVEGGQRPYDDKFFDILDDLANYV